MSVLVKDRTLSKYEFYSNALRLRTALTHLLLKDLGVKNKERNFRFVGNNMSEEDKEIFDTLIAKYGISEFAITILPINADKYVKFIDMIKRETALLKGWRKKDNKRIKEMQQSTSIVK